MWAQMLATNGSIDRGWRGDRCHGEADQPFYRNLLPGAGSVVGSAGYGRRRIASASHYPLPDCGILGRGQGLATPAVPALSSSPVRSTPAGLVPAPGAVPAYQDSGHGAACHQLVGARRRRCAAGWTGGGRRFFRGDWYFPVVTEGPGSMGKVYRWLLRFRWSAPQPLEC